jgi:hypothetical protein
LRDKRIQRKATLNQVLKLEATDMDVWIPSWLGQVSLKLNPEKCELFQKEVWFVGHTVPSEEITTDPEKLKAIPEWWADKNKHEIRSFPGLCTYFRQFISGFANITKPLTILMEEKQAFQWTPEAEGTSSSCISAAKREIHC